MIGQAVIRTGSVENARARVAGLTLPERARLTLLRIGVPRILVLEDGAPPPPMAGPYLELSADRIYDQDKLAALAARDAAQAGPVDASSATFHLANDPASRRQAERALLQSLRKPVDGPVSRHINRYLSLAVTRWLVKTRITPNQMTIVATLFGVAGVWLVTKATWATVALGSLLVQIQSVLDGCDGEIARLKFQSSRFGQWLDNVLDDLVNAGYGLALGFASAEMTGVEAFKWLGIFAAAAVMVYNLVVYWQLARHHGTGNPFAFRWWFQKDDGQLQGSLTGALSFFYALCRRDVFLFAFMVLAFANLPQLAVLWYAILCAGYLLMAVIHMLNGGMPATVRKS